MCPPGRHLAQGVPGHLDRPAGGRTGDGVGGLVAGGRRAGGERRPGPRRRADGRRDQSLGRAVRSEGDAMSRVGEAEDLLTECRDLAERAKSAARELAIAPGGAKDRWLRRSAEAIRERSAEILEANARDVEAAPGLGLNPAAIDRLTLNPKRLDEMAKGLLEVAALPDPVGEVITSSRRPNGLDVTQVRVPLGVIFMIFESRPNVTVDAAALCVKSGNAAILRGGKEAIHSNRALHRVLADELASSGLPEDSVALVADDRPRGRRAPAPDARLHRPGHPSRRRRADPPGRRRGRDARPEALQRHLPRLRRRPRRPRDGRPGRSSTPRPTAPASATPPRSSSCIAPSPRPSSRSWPRP